ncbi:methyl-accepting chemotaxis protein, partial [Nocardioides mangrovicus]
MGRRIAVIVTIAAVITLAVGVVALSAQASQAAKSDRVRKHLAAVSIAHELDTRSSELKVDALKAAAGDNPAQYKNDVADDTATATALLSKLRATVPDATDKADVTKLKGVFATYETTINGYIDTAVADPTSARSNVAAVQKANDAVDEALDREFASLQADADRASKQLDALQSSSRTTVVLAILVGLALLGGISFLISRSLVRPLRQAIDAVERLADGDLSLRLTETASGCTGDLQKAYNRAANQIHEVVSSVTGSADAVAAAAEELSANSQQIAAGAEETSVQ